MSSEHKKRHASMEQKHVGAKSTRQWGSKLPIISTLLKLINT